MPLTLGNNLTSSILRENDLCQRKAFILGNSLTSGYRKDLPAIDYFLGNCLSDKVVLIKGISQNISYTTNMLSVAEAHLEFIASALMESLSSIETSGFLSRNKSLILQQQLVSQKSQINKIINSAEFDNRKLFCGDVFNFKVRTGVEIHNQSNVSIKDFSKGKLFRSSSVELINSWMSQDHTRCGYYNTQNELDQDLAKNNISINDLAIKKKGAGTGKYKCKDLANILVGLRANDSESINYLNKMLPETLASLKFIVPYDKSRNFINANNNQIAEALMRIRGQDQEGAKPEVINLLKDDPVISIANPKDKHLRLIARDVYTTALKTIRAEQASIANQKSNLLAITDALRSAANITEQAADPYLKTDYVLTAQEYAETIRHLIAAITVLQAGNRISEAAQRLIDDLTK
jgi:flagellin-like hook-associated protein FlgL